KAELVAALRRLEEKRAVVACALAPSDGDGGAPTAGWVRPRDLELAGRLERARPRSDRGVLLSPFDPLLWDRKRVVRLFGFDELRAAVPWKAERRRMYDRDVDVPRLTTHYHLGPERGELERVPAAIQQAAGRLIAETRVPFNAVGLNLYRDGRDSVAPHND